MHYASQAWAAQTQPLSTEQYRVTGHQVMYCLCTNPFCGSWQKKSFPPLPASWWGQQPRKSVALSQHPSTSPPHAGKLTVLPCGLGNPSGVCRQERVKAWHSTSVYSPHISMALQTSLLSWSVFLSGWYTGMLLWNEHQMQMVILAFGNITGGFEL